MLKNTNLNLKSTVIANEVKQSHQIATPCGLAMMESGRSMVEMLGVLAIIGVLSVAGIAGYTTAMRSYRTNEIVNAASMLYVMAMAQNAGNGPTGNVTYASLNNGTNPSGVSDITYTNGSITIKFNTKEDCDAAKAKLGDKAGECPATATDGAYPLTVTLGEAENCSKNVNLCASWQKCEGGECVCDSTKISTTNSPCPPNDDACRSSESIECDVAQYNQSLDAANCKSKTQVRCTYG